MLVQRGIRVIPCCLYEPMKRGKAIKGQSKESVRLSDSKHCSYAFARVPMLVQSYLSLLISNMLVHERAHVWEIMFL